MDFFFLKEGRKNKIRVMLESRREKSDYTYGLDVDRVLTMFIFLFLFLKCPNNIFVNVY